MSTDPPYPEPDRLVVVDMLFGTPDGEMNTSIWSYPRYLALREEVESVEELALRDLILTEQMDLLIETGEIETSLEASGLSLHDVVDGDGLTADMVAAYLAPARAALVEGEG